VGRRKLNNLTQITRSCPSCHSTLPDLVTHCAARPPTSPAHVPRRPAANLISSHAVPPNRRAHRLPRRPRRPPAHLSSLSGHWSPTPGPCNANTRPPGLCLHREGEVRPPLRSPTTDDCHAQVSSSPLPRGRFGERFFFHERDLATTVAVGRGCGLHHHEGTTLHHGRHARGWMQ
jgi:hypothetical protein